MAVDVGALPVGAVVAGRYRIERKLGSGGFGSVYAATSTADGQRVALKVLDRAVLEMVGGEARFRREAELARRLRHPHVVKVLDEGTDPQGTPFIAFELLEGRSVEEEIQQWGAFRQRRAANIVCDVLLALEEAHRTGIIHRDLKPANIYLLQGGDRVKVLDFGIAKSVKPGTMAGLTEAGMLIGSPVYMATEQLTGGEIGPATDIYSLGVVLLEMLIGRMPYEATSSAMEIVSDRLGGMHVPIPVSIQQLPLGAVIDHATQSDASQRYASAAQMRDAIRGAIAAPGFVDGVVASSDPASAAFSRSEVFAPTQGVAAGGVVPTAAGTGAAQFGSSAQVGAPSPGGGAFGAAGGGMAPPTAAAGPAGMVPPTVAGVTPPTVVGAPQGAFVPYGTQPAVGPGPAWSAPPGQGQGLMIGAAAPQAGPGAQAPSPSSSANWTLLAVGGGVLLIFLLGIGAAIGASFQASVRAPDDDDADLIEEAPVAPRPRATATRKPRPIAQPIEVAEPVVTGPRVKPCPRAPAVNQAVLRRHIVAIGWRVTGTSIHCLGNMVNFRCQGTQGRGYTVAKGDEKGSVTPLRFPSAAKAGAYVANEKRGVTLAVGGNVVIHIDMPEAAADKLTARMCK